MIGRTLALALLALLTAGCTLVQSVTGAATGAVGAAGGDKSKMVTTASGLKYEDIQVGTGAEARSGQQVQVHYVGWLALDDNGTPGKKFDSSRDHNQPFTFNLGRSEVIKGWDEGVTGMKVGGKRKLVIPPALGYGAQGVGDGLIPPNSTLVFEVELLAVR